MKAGLKLSPSPNLSTVVEQLRAFTSTHGPTDLYYRGSVKDEGETYSFRGLLHVARVFPFTGRMALTLGDLWHTWTVQPVQSYSFEIVPRGAAPSRQVEPIDIAKIWPEWAAEIAPYQAAAKAADLPEILRQLGFRKPVSVNGQAVVHKLFPASRRGGVYVLHFANGQHYVGQSVDVLHRLRQHQRRFADIEAVSFRSLGRKRLDFHEAELIRLLERRGLTLRNIAMTSVLAEEPAAFDELMTVEEQARWLCDPSFLDLGGERVEPATRNVGLTERYRLLSQEPDYTTVRRVLRAYVRNTVPAIKRAEAAYWQLSCLPPGYAVLARININWQEVFFANRDDVGLYFYFCLSKLLLQTAFGDDLSGLAARYPELEWEDGLYRAGGGDQLTVIAWSPEAAEAFVTDPDVIPAMRHFNLRLMKRGRCPWANSHNFDLATDLLSEQPAL